MSASPTTHPTLRAPLLMLSRTHRADEPFSLFPSYTGRTKKTRVCVCVRKDEKINPPPPLNNKICAPEQYTVVLFSLPVLFCLGGRALIAPPWFTVYCRGKQPNWIHLCVSVPPPETCNKRSFIYVKVLFFAGGCGVEKKLTAPKIFSCTPLERRDAACEGERTVLFPYLADKKIEFIKRSLFCVSACIGNMCMVWEKS